MWGDDSNQPLNAPPKFKDWDQYSDRLWVRQKLGLRQGLGLAGITAFVVTGVFAISGARVTFDHDSQSPQPANDNAQVSPEKVSENATSDSLTPTPPADVDSGQEDPDRVSLYIGVQLLNQRART